MTKQGLNQAVALAETLIAQLPLDQQDHGHTVVHAFQYALALMDEMQRRLSVADGTLNQIASTATRTATEVDPQTLDLHPLR